MSHDPISLPIAYDAIPLEGVRAALLDLDDTLYAYPPAHKAALRGVYAELQHAIDFASFETQYHHARQTVTTRLAPQGACRSRLFAFQLLYETWGVPAAFAHAARLDQRYWHHFMAAMQPDTGAMRLIARCRAAKIRLCIVSDMTAAVQVEKIAVLGLTQAIDFLVTSEEVGAEKPAPDMFKAALMKLELAASDVIMVGDSYEKDILGAEALGIRAYQVMATAHA